MNHSTPNTTPNLFSQYVDPKEAWADVLNGKAVLIDVRSHEELQFVGRVPDSVHIPWATGPELQRNENFLKELASKCEAGLPVYLLCRSGKRSELAAQAAHTAGLQQVFSVLEGFEGDLDEKLQRGRFNGWRFHGLPWEQN